MCPLESISSSGSCITINFLLETTYKKKRDAEDKSCLFCCEEESINHLFFDCWVSKLIWGWISEVTEIQVGVDFESIGRWWISNNKNAVLNCTCAALPVGLHRCPSDTTPTQTDGLACLLVAQSVASYVLWCFVGRCASNTRNLDAITLCTLCSCNRVEVTFCLKKSVPTNQTPSK